MLNNNCNNDENEKQYSYSVKTVSVLDKGWY